MPSRVPDPENTGQRAVDHKCVKTAAYSLPDALSAAEIKQAPHEFNSLAVLDCELTNPLAGAG